MNEKKNYTPLLAEEQEQYTNKIKNN